jgi:activator of HSP90 ATPase
MTVANRKGKIMFFYDFNIKINWTGTMDDDTTAKGALELIEVADGDWPDVETLVTVEGDSAASKTLKEIVRKQGITVAKDTLSAFFADIRSQSTYLFLLFEKYHGS